MNEGACRAVVTLAPDTVARMRELFGGRTCTACGRPAERLTAGTFYCAAHFVRKAGRSAVPLRIYRCGRVEE